MKILALIPARMNSSRFPGKPMALISGKPMIGHVFERVSKSPLLNLTAVATCDKEIVNYIESIGGRAVMTSSHQERASDRCAEALEILEKEEELIYDIVVMVQGDEPMVVPEMIDEAVRPILMQSSIQVVNLMEKVESIEEFESRNCIKVVCDSKSNALYFSREPIPTLSKISSPPMLKQICVIPFRRDFLLAYLKMEPTPLEIAESIDMMRILEHGSQIHMVLTKYSTHSVDTAQDLIMVEKLMTKP